MNSSKPEFWEERYRNNTLRWDFGGVPSNFKKHIDAALLPSRILIPGCGSAYEARHAAEQGWDVVAIDFSEGALKRAAAILGNWKPVLKKEDFFAVEGSFNAMYERAFLAALPPELRSAYGDQVRKLVAPGGQLFGYFVVGNTSEAGPPYAIPDAELCKLLTPAFERVMDVVPKDTMEVFKGKERFQVWQRRT